VINCAASWKRHKSCLGSLCKGFEHNQTLKEFLFLFQTRCLPLKCPKPTDYPVKLCHHFRLKNTHNVKTVLVNPSWESMPPASWFQESWWKYVRLEIAHSSKRNSTSALYRIFWMKKSQNVLVWISKMVLAQHFSRGYWGWQKAQESLTPAVDWLDSFIGPGGLLSVVSHLLQSKLQFHGWGWEKVDNISWMWEIVLQGPYTEHGWGCC
jgi:hypothetical protein